VPVFLSTGNLAQEISKSFFLISAQTFYGSTCQHWLGMVHASWLVFAALSVAAGNAGSVQRSLGGVEMVAAESALPRLAIGLFFFCFSRRSLRSA